MDILVLMVWTYSNGGLTRFGVHKALCGTHKPRLLRLFETAYGSVYVTVPSCMVVLNVVTFLWFGERRYMRLYPTMFAVRR